MDRKEIEEFVITLRDKCLDEIADLLPECVSPGNIIVATVRKYGRIWDDKAKLEKDISVGGFVKFMKSLLLNTLISEYESSVKEEIHSSLKYL